MARIGTFSESVVCPAEMLVPIRKEMPWPQAAPRRLLRAHGRGRRHLVREGRKRAPPVLVIGCGGVGLNVVQGARLAGAGMIVACDLLEQQARLCEGVRRDPHLQRQAGQHRRARARA